MAGATTRRVDFSHDVKNRASPRNRCRPAQRAAPIEKRLGVLALMGCWLVDQIFGAERFELGEGGLPAGDYCGGGVAVCQAFS